MNLLEKRGNISLVIIFVLVLTLIFVNLVSSYENDTNLTNYENISTFNSSDINLDDSSNLKENSNKQELNFEKGPVKNIKFKDLNVKNIDKLKIDDVPEKDIKEKNFIKVYAIDPTLVDFTEATVTITAKGNLLYKCKEWDFENRICNGEWKLIKSDLTPGKDYTFTLTPEDPAFGEIIATNALHLNSNYNTISDIYDQIKTKDDIFSEPINNGEYVRVTFAEDLTIGRLIDVYAKSNSQAYFEIYEAGTNNFVGRSSVIDREDLQYITVLSLTKPTNVFDFKIFNFSENNSSIEFDYIHDDVINATQATGLICYSTAGVTTPKYRIWNDTYNFTAALNAQNVGGNIFWSLLKSNHERNESILGTIDSTLGINVQIFNSTGWGNLKKLSSSIVSLSTRPLGIGIEQVSGDINIFYENSALNNNQIGYQVWNGTNYSNEINFSTNLAASPAVWIMAFPEQGSNNIMVLIHNNANDLEAQYWNGTGFDPTMNLTLSTGTDSNTEPHFNFAWESSSGQGLVTYGAVSNIVYRTFQKIAPYWSTEANIPLGGGQTLRASRLCSDSNSDYIGIIWQDSGSDVNASIWNGAQLLNNGPLENPATEPSGTNNANLDCAWEKSGTKVLFGYTNNNALSISNFTYNKLTNTWSTSTLVGIPGTGNFASDDIEGLRFNANPVTDEIMVTTLDILEDMYVIRWNGTAFIRIQSALETTTQTTNAAQENAMFDWSRYDPVPNVTINHPAPGTNYTINTILNISANVTDNINVSAVLANITIPNGTIDQIILYQRDTTTNKITYNNTYSNTGVIGTYNILFIANDTSTFKNINQTITTNFVIQESQIAPNVTLIYPLGNSKFNATNIVNFTINVTDSNVTYVFANLTLANGTQNRLRMYNTSAYDIYNFSYTAPLLLGLYNITFMANDSANNMNNTLITNFTIYDDLQPNVTSIFPDKNSLYNVSDIIQISVNATDLWSIAQTIAAFVYPNGTLYNLTLINKTNYPNKFNNSFVIPNQTGTYNITFYVNDTNNNLNNSEITNFTVNRVNALTINPLGCLPSIVNLSSSVTCNATASDETAIGTVSANVTLPNGTIEVQSVSNNGNNYNFTFTHTYINNSYNVYWWVNDSDGNTKNTTDSFNVVDPIEPNITLLYPENNLNISATAFTINFSAIDNYATTLNCSLIIDSITNKTNSAVSNGTQTSFIVTGLINRTTYLWNISCKDSSLNTNTSETRRFTIDIDKPRFFLLNTTPATEDLLDPNVVINVTANVTEDTTYVSLVVIQYKLSNNTDFINLTTTYDSNLYNASFTAVQNGTYTIRLWANDSLNNNDYSNSINISVQIDKNWTRTPISFNPVAASLNQNISIGNLSITNAGDTGVNFTIISDSVTTHFNHSSNGLEGNATTNFTLNIGETINIQVNDSSNVQGIKTIKLTITPNSDWFPIQLNTTGTISVAENQPLLSTTFIVPTTDTLTITQGDTNVNFKAKLENVGFGNATNVTLAIDIPDDWEIILGSLTTNIDELNSGDNIENNILVNIPSNTSTGTFRVIANATATNASEANMSSEGLIFGDEVLVTINSKEIGAAVTPSGGGAVSAGAGIGGGGGGSSIKTVETFDVLRGTNKIVPIEIKNIYSNSILKNVKIEVTGFLSQYIKISPEILNNINYLNSKNFNLNVFVPSYFSQKDFNLNLKITGDIVSINQNRYGTYDLKPLKQEKTIKLIVREVSSEKALTYVDKIKKYIQEFKDNNLPYTNLEKLDQDAQTAFDNLDYEKVKLIEEQVEIIQQNAFYANDLIKELESEIQKAENEWLNIPETKRGLELAKKAFEREDFVVALERAKNSQVMFILETKGKINILWFLINYWWAIIIGFVMISILSYILYKNVTIFIINQRISNINKEEEALQDLFKEAQEDYFNKKTISETEYNKLITHYSNRLNKIRQIRIKLRNRRIGIIKTEQEIKNIENEKKDTIQNMKEIQSNYLQKGKMSRNQFLKLDEQDKLRLAEIEEEEQLLKEKLERQKLTKSYKVLKEVEKVYPKDKPQEKKKAKRMSREELEKWFPGAFK